MTIGSEFRIASDLANISQVHSVISSSLTSAVWEVRKCTRILGFELKDDARFSCRLRKKKKSLFIESIVLEIVECVHCRHLRHKRRSFVFQGD